MHPVSRLESADCLICVRIARILGTQILWLCWINESASAASSLNALRESLAFSRYLLLKRLFSSTQASNFTYTGLS